MSFISVSSSTFRAFAVISLLYALIAAAMMGSGNAHYENLHTVLDTGNAMLSSTLAVFLWYSQRIEANAIRVFLAISFAFSAISELLHALVGIEWQGHFAIIATYSETLRPATWPPSTYLLPLAVLLFLWMKRHNIKLRPWVFTGLLALLLPALLALFLYLPSYVDTEVLAVHRPYQLGVIPLWVVASWSMWKKRNDSPLFIAVCYSGVLLTISDIFMLFSTSPHEQFAMAAHLGKMAAYLLLHINASAIAAADLDARLNVQKALEESEERWKFALEGSGDGVWDWNLQTGKVFFSNRCKEVLGYDEDDYESRLLSWESTLHPDDYRRTMAELRAHLEGLTDSYSNEHRARYKDGSWKWLLTRGMVVSRDANGKALRMIGTQSDISQRKQAEEAAQMAALVFENGSEGMVVTSADGTIIAINPAFTQLTGYTPEEAVGKNPKILQSGRQDADFYQAMWHRLTTTGHWHGEIWNRRKSGEIYAEWLSINSIYNKDGSVSRRVALFSDITKRKQSEELIWQQANFDILTGLPNRSMFRDRLDQAVKKAHRADLPLALMFIDLDHFKEINDTLGHEMGDVLLVEAAQRLNNCVRETDTVARLGGDEFTVILGELDDPGNVERVAQAILKSLAEPFQLVGNENSQISASIGITFYPKDATGIDDLLKNADQAMYAAKDQGRNAYCFFTPSMQDAILNRLQLTADLREALAYNQFLVYYQPIVDISTGAIGKVEALIRWQHPTRGLINPDDFIPLAEETGLIAGIGAWVLRTACSQAVAWRARQQAPLRVAVNVSARQFYEGCFIETVRDILAETGLPPEALELEITEGMLMHNLEHAIATVQALRAVGVQISEDDFGTGYSSLNYLKQFSINTLKIDQSFIRDLGNDPDDAALVTAIIAMAQSLHLSVIAEGVETAGQLAFLRNLGCTQCQGFLFAKPMPEQEFGAFLAAPHKSW